MEGDERKMSKPKAREERADMPAQKEVIITKIAEAEKLSLRGDGRIAYQVGRVGDSVHVRIEKNHGGGSCSKEWVKEERLTACITQAMRRGEPFKSDALAAAFVGKSQCNSGFLVAVLRAERVFDADSERKGMSRLATPDALDKWVEAMRALAPLTGDDGQLTAKLRAEPKETQFRPKQSAPATDDAEQGDGATPPSEGAASDGDAKPRRLVRIRRKLAEELGVAGESEAVPADDGDAAEAGGGIDPAAA